MPQEPFPPPVGWQQGQDDAEIPIGYILSTAMKRWKLMAAIITLFVAIGVAYALSKPNIYESSATLLVNKGLRGEGGGGIMSGLQQYSGLLNLMGAGNMGGGDPDVERAMIMLGSRTFITKYVTQYELLPILFPKATPEQLKDPNIMDAACDFVRTNIKLGQDGIAYTLSVRHSSPESAYLLAQTVIKALNEFMKENALNDERNDIAHINEQLRQITILEIRQVLLSLLMSKTKELTLIEGQQEYVFKVADPPLLPKEKVGPVRTYIVIAFMMLGTLVSVGAALLPIIKDVVFKGAPRIQS